jgi:Heavy metal binding domain
MKKLVLAIALFTFGTTVSFAQNEPTAKTEHQHAAKPKKAKKAKKTEAVTMYECPMKCEPATAKAGKCSKCGMDLVAVKPKSK